jgi:energy-coupling factor transport system ATP-binding protein
VSLRAATTIVAGTAPVLHLQRISFAYDPAVPLIADLEVAVRAGEVLAVVGPNGSGKSTLLKLINGLLRPTGGRVLLAGDDITGRRVDELARTIGTVFQVPEQQLFEPTVEREVSFGPRQLGVSSFEVADRVADALDRTGLSAEAKRHPLDLPHAMRRFVALASALANRPRLLLLDEPQRGLDRQHVARLETIIAEESARGTATVLVCHDAEFVTRNATAVLSMRQGRHSD